MPAITGRRTAAAKITGGRPLRYRGCRAATWRMPGPEAATDSSVVLPTVSVQLFERGSFFVTPSGVPQRFAGCVALQIDEHRQIRFG
jgi:hypothetical protein